jgi:hypothetical protein
MAIPFAIPKDLKEFAPILEWFSNIPPEELNEDLDPTHVVSFLRSRYGDLEVDELERRLKSDRKAFDKLEKVEGAHHPWLHFFGTYLLMAPHILADTQPPETDDNQLPPPLIVHVQLPNDFEIEIDYGSVRARNAQVDIELVPTAESVLEYKLHNLKQQELWSAKRQDQRVRSEYLFSLIDLTPVSGRKVTIQEPSQRGTKNITYLLKVPGGACFVEVHCKDARFDESKLEEHLRTANVETTTLD